MTSHKNIHAVAMMAGFMSAISPALADDSEAKAAFKVMSDFLSAQQVVSANYDATLEIVTAELMKVGLESSGTIAFQRPDKIRMTRNAGIADVEMAYDGQMLTVYGKKLNVFGKLPLKGNLDDAVATLRDDYGLELPAADLLSTAPYDAMMENVTEATALGEGVVHGKICDHLAFRTAEVDWQIWIAQGDKPYPCRFTITSKLTAMAPSYSIQFDDWQSGAELPADNFQLKPAAGAKELPLSELNSLDEVPQHAAEGGVQ